ncbi:MAG: GNAT family N-acetyltransferase [Actinomycetota bacterium]
MSRPLFAVRRVTPELEPDFTALLAAACVENSAASVARAATEERVALAFARDDVRAYLAFTEGRPVGYILLTCSPLSFLTDSQRVSIEQIFVVPEARRGGAARALLNAAATYADRLGADQIAGLVPVQGREANRFFARLGFTSDVARRVTTASALHRKLATGDETHPALDRLLQHRRSLRARATRSADLIHR